MASSIYKVILDAQDKTAQAFSKVQRNLDKTQRATDKVKKSLGGMKSAIGLAAGAVGFGALAKSAADTADALAKTSSKLGVTADALFTFQTQANLAGISTDTANMALQRFVRRTAEAAQGSGEAKAALKELRLDAEKLQQLPLDERMNALSDAFANVENPADRLRLAFKLFDSEGASMVNMLGQGSEALEKQRDEFDALGLTIEGTSLEAIESFNDSMTILKRQVEAALIKGLAEAAPEVEKLAEKFSELAVPLVGDVLDGLTFIIDNIDTVITGIKLFLGAMVVKTVVSFGAAIAALVVATGPIGLAIVAFGAVAAAVVLFMDEIKAMLKPLADAGAAVYDFVQKINPFSSDVDEAAEAARGLAIAEGVLEEATGSAASELLVLRSAGNDVTEATENAEGTTGEFADAIERVKDESRPAATSVEGFGEKTDTTAGQAQEAAVQTNEFADAIERLEKLSRDASDEVVDFEAQLEEFQKAVENSELTSSDFNAALRKMVTDMTGVKDTSEDLENKIILLESAIEQMNERFDESDPLIRDLKDELAEARAELEELLDPTQKLTQAQQDLLDTINGLTPEVKKAHEEIANLNVLYEQGLITVDEFRQRTDLLAESLKETGTGADDAEKELGDFLTKVGEGNADLSDLVRILVGEDGVKNAINDCFGTGPVTAFDNAVKSLFPTFGEFEGVLGSLNGALDDFFQGGELKFSAFKDAILETLADIAAGAIASVGINFLKNLIPGLNTGGSLDGYAYGGRVTGPGGPKDDKVLARLSAGEYVIQASSVSKFGKGFFDTLNAGKMPVPGLRLGGIFESIVDMIRNNTLIYGGDAPFSQYLFDLYQLLSQEDPRDSPDEAYELAMEIILARIMRAIVNANNMMDTNVGTKILGNGKIGEILAGIAGPIGALSQQGFLNRFSDFNADSTIDGLRDAIYDALFGPVSSISARAIGFNMDDVVARLFNSSNAVSGGSLTMNKREFGGPLERGQAALVGEGGPELFIPGSGGTVSPIASNGGKELIGAVHEVRDEIADLRRQMSRIMAGQALAGGRA